MVERQVRRAGLERGLDVGARFVGRLPGERIHEIEVDVVEGVPRNLDRAVRFLVVMNAAERFQVLGIEALDADREAVHAGLAIAAEFFSLESPGIRLQGDLAIGGERQACAERRDERPDRRRGKQARRAAAEKNAVDSPPPYVGKRELQICHERLDVGLFGDFPFCLVGIEIAVRTFPHAPGNVDVERKRRELRQAHSGRRRREGDAHR